MAKVSIKAAASGRNHHSYNPLTVGSMDFGELACTRIIETVPGDDFSKIACSSFLRLSPLIFPTFGRVFLKSGAFFVPEHQIIEYSGAWHSNMTTYKGKSIHMPYIEAFHISYLFYNDSSLSTNVGTTAAGVTPPTGYDFYHIINGGGNATQYKWQKLTPKGRRYFKILKSLGYDFPSYINNNSYSDTKSASDEKLNALPLLAYAKIYVDMFLNGVFYNASQLVALLHAIRNNDDYVAGTYYTQSTGQIHSAGLFLILDSINVPFEQNMYLTAWNGTNSPDGINPQMNSGLNTGSNMGMFMAENTLLGVNNTGIEQPSASPRQITANGLRVLKAFDAFVRRWNMSGSKAVQRIYSMFGIRTDDFNSHYVHKLHEGSERIDFSPVVSNSNTVNGSQGSPLGAYGGFGVGSLNYEFSYKANDYGFIVCLDWLNIVPIMPRGFNPMVLRMNGYDWYTPQFDGKALRAIPKMEVSLNRKATDLSANNGGDKAVYGFTRVYQEYREMKDSVFGDFVLDDNVRNFLMSRDLSKLRETGNGTLLPQSNGVQYFNNVPSSSDIISNPFTIDATVADRFYLFCDFDIQSNRCISSDSESFDLGLGDTEVSVNGVMMS